MSKIHHAILIDESVTFTLAEICQTCNVHAELIIEMVEYGFLEPRGKVPMKWQFNNKTLQRVKTAVHLQHDLGVNMAGIALVLELLDELKELREKVR